MASSRHIFGSTTVLTPRSHIPPAVPCPWLSTVAELGLSHFAGPIYWAAFVLKVPIVLTRPSQNWPQSVNVQYLVIFIQSDNIHLFICKYTSFNYLVIIM